MNNIGSLPGKIRPAFPPSAYLVYYWPHLVFFGLLIFIIFRIAKKKRVSWAFYLMAFLALLLALVNRYIVDFFVCTVYCETVPY